MRYLLILAPLLIIAGCTMDVCPEQLNLTDDNRLITSDYGEIRSLPKVFDNSISTGGEVHELKVYSAAGQYYVEFQPVHFSTTRIYGPFNGSWEGDLECAV